MEVLGIIPARKGSKGIPGKNRVLLNSKPLIWYTFKAAAASNYLTRVIVSTNDKHIAALAKRNRIEVPFMRPAHLSGSKSPMFGVILHAVQYLKASENYLPDYVVLLQPTSPLRTAAHIDAAIRLLTRTKADSVVSVTQVPHSCGPDSILALKNGELIPFSKKTSPTRRQDKKIWYARNGPAVLVVRTNVLLKKKSLYGRDLRPLIMKRAESIDIDTRLDLELAEFYLRTQI